jgi:hypothetical protein
MLLESKVSQLLLFGLLSRGSVPVLVFLVFLVDFRRSKGFLALVLRSLVGLVGIKGSRSWSLGVRGSLFLLRFFS